MYDKPIKIPTADHPITVEPSKARVVVKIADQTIADSSHALTLREASYPPVQYIPRADVNMGLLERSDHTTYCPYKGECSYFSIAADARGKNAVWTYEAPYDALAAIKDYVAFYPDRVDLIDLRAE